MVTFDLINQDFIIITNPKSGVTTTNNLLANILHEDFKRYDSLDSGIKTGNKRAVFVLRDPYERVVSMFFRFNRVSWTDHTGVRGEVSKKILRKYRKEGGFNFLDFLTYLKETPNDNRDIHYRCQDIPEKYDFLVLTHRYFEDILKFFKKIGNQKGVEILSPKTADEIIANSVKKSDVKEWENMVELKTFEFEKFEKTGFPPYALFLNSETRKLIEDTFKKEIQLYHSVQSILNY